MGTILIVGASKGIGLFTTIDGIGPHLAFGSWQIDTNHSVARKPVSCPCWRHRRTHCRANKSQALDSHDRPLEGVQ